MAALNKDETEALHGAIAFIEEVQRNGYDPEILGDEEKRRTMDISWQRMVRLSKDAEKTRRSLRTIHTMKGYYPK